MAFGWRPRVQDFPAMVPGISGAGFNKDSELRNDG